MLWKTAPFIVFGLEKQRHWISLWVIFMQSLSYFSNEANSKRPVGHPGRNLGGNFSHQPVRKSASRCVCVGRQTGFLLFNLFLCKRRWVTAEPTVSGSVSIVSSPSERDKAISSNAYVTTSGASRAVIGGTCRWYGKLGNAAISVSLITCMRFRDSRERHCTWSIVNVDYHCHCPLMTQEYL